MQKYSFIPYNPLFPNLFLEEKKRISSHVKNIERIEHIGSTAIPHLGGKGIIDIAVSTQKEHMQAVSKQLQELGYEFRPVGSTADRFYFRVDLPDPEQDTRRYHLHLLSSNHQEWLDFLAFRDYLRNHPEEAIFYADLKKKAVEVAKGDGSKYRELKDPAFKRILEKSHFERTIINTFGTTGKQWLIQLPEIVKHLTTYWLLTKLCPINKMSYHFIAKAIDHQNRPVVLKVGCDGNLIHQEMQALQYFNAEGAIKLLDYNEEHKALLLDQAFPGTSLKSLYPKQLDTVMDVYATVLQRLHNQHCLNKNSFDTIRNWLVAIDTISSPLIPQKLLSQALITKNTLLSSMTHEKLLHGDLHLENILSHHDEWICIDPKGVIGEVEFEVAAFTIFDKSEIDTATKELLFTRIRKLADKTNLSFERIKDWFFVRFVLSAVWAIEDHQHPKVAIQLASLFL